MSILISGKTVVATLVFEMPAGVEDKDAAQIMTGISVTLPLTGMLRGSFAELKHEEARQVVERYADRLSKGMGPKKV